MADIDDTDVVRNIIEIDEDTEEEEEEDTEEDTEEGEENTGSANSESEISDIIANCGFEYEKGSFTES